MSKKAIGIDLGSTFSSVAIIEGGQPTVIVNEDGKVGTPSIVNLHNENERKVGELARRQRIMQPKETVDIIKRFMGATYSESAEALKHVQYDVTNVGGMPRVTINGKQYSPEEISSMILGKMKKIAEDYCGEEITDAIITVPAYFSNAAREATIAAGKIAGLNVLRVIAEPTAALLASKIDMKKGGLYMVTDFGGKSICNASALSA
jgi:molecular chaperone DnaK